MKYTPFQIVKNLTSEHIDKWEEYKSSYNQFMINRCISKYRDILPIANTMNCTKISDKEHYYFLFHAIEKKYRPYKKWYKKEKKSDYIKYIAYKYQINDMKAEEMLPLLYEEELVELKKSLKGIKIK